MVSHPEWGGGCLLAPAQEMRFVSGKLGQRRARSESQRGGKMRQPCQGADQTHHHHLLGCSGGRAENQGLRGRKATALPVGAATCTLTGCVIRREGGREEGPRGPSKRLEPLTACSSTGASMLVTAPSTCSELWSGNSGTERATTDNGASSSHLPRPRRARMALQGRRLENHNLQK